MQFTPKPAPKYPDDKIPYTSEIRQLSPEPESEEVIADRVDRMPLVTNFHDVSVELQKLHDLIEGHDSNEPVESDSNVTDDEWRGTDVDYPVPAKPDNSAFFKFDPYTGKPIESKDVL